MQNYDEIQGFEYWNIEAWKDFIKNYIIPLYNSSSKLLKLRNFILINTERKDITLTEIEKRQKQCIPFLLGGIEKNGEYKNNSLAKLIRLSLGIYINPKEWVTLEKEEGIKAFDYIVVQNENTKFLEFLKELNSITLNIIKLTKVEFAEASKSEIENIFQKPEEILEILKNIYVKCLQVCANHNYYTFFILSIMKIPRKLLELAYKKIKDNFDILKDFLDMVKYFEPETTDENLKEAYTAWSYSEKSIGDGIYKLNKIIWDYFNIDGVKNIWEFFTASTPNIKQNFKEIVINTIGENYNKFNLLPQYISENFEEKCKICDKEKVDYYCYDFEYELSGMIITSVNHSIRLSSGSYSYYSHKINISLQSFFNDIFQILFTKLIDYEIRDKKISLEWVK